MDSHSCPVICHYQGAHEKRQIIAELIEYPRFCQAQDFEHRPQRASLDGFVCHVINSATSEASPFTHHREAVLSAERQLFHCFLLHR